MSPEIEQKAFCSGVLNRWHDFAREDFQRFGIRGKNIQNEVLHPHIHQGLDLRLYFLNCANDR
jgi:hypothetical protein